MLGSFFGEAAEAREGPDPHSFALLLGRRMPRRLGQVAARVLGALPPNPQDLSLYGRGQRLFQAPIFAPFARAALAPKAVNPRGSGGLVPQRRRLRQEVHKNSGRSQEINHGWHGWHGREKQWAVGSRQSAIGSRQQAAGRGQAAVGRRREKEGSRQ